MSKSPKKSRTTGRTRPRRKPGAGDAARLLATAMEQHQGGQLQAAEAVYRQALLAWPENADAWHRLGTLYAQADQFDRALTCLAKAAELSPENASFHSDLGNANMASGGADEAIDCYKAALALKPDHAEAHFNLGNALYSLGQLDEAAEAYRRTAELQPDKAQSHARLGAALQQLDRIEEAIAAFREALRHDPHLIDAHDNLGGALFAQGRLKPAAAAFRQALEIDPGRVETHLKLGNVLHEQGKSEHALACFRRAAELDPDLALAHANIGSILHDQGELKEAATALRRALAIDASHAQGFVDLGMTLQEIGDAKGAVRAFKRALKIKPGDNRAQAHLAVALQQSGQKQDAQALLDFRQLVKTVAMQDVEGWPSVEAFNKALAEHIVAHPTLARERPGKSVSGAGQTPEILFDDHPAIAALRGAIGSAVADYFEGTLRRGGNPYAAPPPERWRLAGRAVVLRSGGHQGAQCHPEAVVSGAYYVQVPQAVKSVSAGNAGFLEFGQPSERQKAKFKSRKYLTSVVKPAEGTMVLFPSYFWYSTIPFRSRQDMICIAFNVLPE